MRKITLETGGEIIDAQMVGSLASAMSGVISRLKQRYTLGYQSTNKRQEGSFRAIEVRLNDGVRTARSGFKVYARRGYFAPLVRSAHNKTP